MVIPWPRTKSSWLGGNQKLFGSIVLPYLASQAPSKRQRTSEECSAGLGKGKGVGRLVPLVPWEKESGEQVWEVKPMIKVPEKVEPTNPPVPQHCNPPATAPPSSTGTPMGSIGKGSKGSSKGSDDQFLTSSFPPPVLSQSAINNRLRRVFQPRADGSYLVDSSWIDQYKDKESRDKLFAMFEKVGYVVDWVWETYVIVTV